MRLLSGRYATGHSNHRPASELAPSSAEQAEAQKLLQDRYGTIMKTHMRLTTHFFDNTQYGRKHWAELARFRTGKLRRPQLELGMIAEALDIPVMGLRTV
jgi:hypothetical protein